MLHFRFSTVLKDLAHLKRPLPGSSHKTWVATRHLCCPGAADTRAVQLKLLHAAAAHRPGFLTAHFRSYCAKTEGAVALDEQPKKDGVGGEAASDKRRNAGILPSLEDLLFYTVAEGQEKIPAHKFLTALKATGLRSGDPRLKECMETLKETLKNTSDGVTLDRHLFKKCVQSNIVLLTQAFRKKFVIPDFQSFSSHIDELYESAKNLSGGQVADYIPQLAKFSPDLWAVSLCTVDGQRHTVGDTKVPFCLQSCVKPLKYAVAVHDHGTEYVHSFIGKEPSGLRFNKLFLNEDDRPHNPMVNAGAIVCTSLIKGASNAEKFDYVMNFLKQMAGNEYVGFSNATFQSERESGDRNFAIGYYLKEKKCFPEGIDMTSVLDLYFQLCSIEVTCESASVMAATLANGGICPITGERVLSPEAVRNTLSLMHSCGMYDFSGQFAFHVGLPAKSGVAGGILLVVPNVMGIMCWSPPLDKLGNSVRGIHFCTDLVELFNFHNYDNLRHFAKKHDPRREGGDQRQLCFGPMDYESLQQELALKAPLWKKVSPTESHQDSSTTVVYRMDNVGK
ncbi:glutaminase kidney isoform, mitochondrial isoform 2-T2 [Aulostomus maculatus]